MVLHDRWLQARSRSLCLLACFAILLLTPVSALADAASEHLDRSRKLNDNRQVTTSMMEVNQALSARPRYPEALVHRGWLFLQMGKPDPALRDFEDSLKFNPKYYEGYVSRGYVLRILKRYDESRAETEKAMRLDPKRPEGPYLHGLSCLVEGYTNPAIKSFDKAIAGGSRHPLLSYAYYWRGRAREMNKDYSMAIVDFSKAIKYESQLRSKGYVKNYGPFSDPRILANEEKRNTSLGVLERGLCYSKIGQYEPAIADFTLVLKSDPNETLMYEERGNAYLKIGKYKQALQDFNRAVLKGSPSSKLYLYLALTHYCLGAYDKAVADVDAWLGRTFWNDDQTVFAVILKHSALSRLGKKAEARTLALTALNKLKKDQAWPYPALDLLVGRSSPPKCLALVSKAGKRRQTEARAYIGLTSRDIGDGPAALENFGWVVKNGDRTTDEFTIAHSELIAKTTP